MPRDHVGVRLRDVRGASALATDPNGLIIAGTGGSAAAVAAGGYKQATGSSAAFVNYPNASGYTSVPGCTFTITAGSVDEDWLIDGEATVKADSANWTLALARVAVWGNVIGGTLVTASLSEGRTESAGSAQGAATDNGQSQIHISNGTITIPAGKTYAFSLQACGNGAYGILLYGAQTRLRAHRVNEKVTATVVPVALGAFSVYKTSGATQAVAANTFTKVSFQQREYDPNLVWDATNNRFVAQQAGVYRLGAALYFATAGREQLVIYKNGVSYKYIGMAEQGLGFGTCDVVANVGDYFELWCYSFSIANTINDSANLTYFQGEFVGMATYTQSGIPTATVLPTTNLVDGQEVYLKVDTAGTYGGPYLWHCKYDASLPSNKWYVLKGVPLKSLGTATAFITGVTVHTTLPSGPSITVPVAGIYDVDGAAFVATNGGAGTNQGNIGVSLNAAAPVGAVAAVVGTAQYGGGRAPFASSTLTVPTGGVLTARVYNNTATPTMNYSLASLAATPVRIGG